MMIDPGEPKPRITIELVVGIALASAVPAAMFIFDIDLGPYGLMLALLIPVAIIATSLAAYKHRRR